MSEEYYRPIIKEGDHLDRSKKNPDRVRGVSRDSNNKNPDIIEWEKVKLPEENHSSSYYDYEDDDDYDDEDEIEYGYSTLSDIASIIGSIATITETVATFIDEHPEAAKAAYKFLKDKKNKFFRKIKGKKAKNINKNNIRATVVQKAEPNTTLLSVETSDIIESPKSDENQPEQENLTLDEARELALEILLDYINLKKKVDRLKKAKVNDTDFQEIDTNVVFQKLEEIIKEYPALMNKDTTDQILNLLKINKDASENKKIKEILNIKEEIQ